MQKDNEDYIIFIRLVKWTYMDMLKSISVFYPGGKPNIVDESEDVGGAKVHEGEQRLKVRVIPGVERMDGWMKG